MDLLSRMREPASSFSGQRALDIKLCPTQVIVISLGSGKDVIRLSQCGAPTHEIPTTMPEVSPNSLRTVCGIFNVPQSLWTLTGCETGSRSTVYSSCPRRLQNPTICRWVLESLTICRWLFIGSAFYWVISRPWVLIRPRSRFWICDLRT